GRRVGHVFVLGTPRERAIRYVKCRESIIVGCGVEVYEDEIAFDTRRRRVVPRNGGSAVRRDQVVAPNHGAIGGVEAKEMEFRRVGAPGGKCNHAAAAHGWCGTRAIAHPVRRSARATIASGTWVPRLDAYGLSPKICAGRQVHGNA